jgi:hypothetical protein
MDFSFFSSRSFLKLAGEKKKCSYIPGSLVFPHILQWLIDGLGLLKKWGVA